MGRKLAITSLLFLMASLFLKVSGLLRDMVIAYYFGDSYQAVAYFAAFTLPNIFILFFTTGMKNAFVPSYIQANAAGSANHHFSQVFRASALFGLIVSIAGIALSPLLLPLMFPEIPQEALQLSIYTSMIFFASVLFVSLNSVYEAYLDAENKFSLSAISQICVIGGAILGTLLFAERFGVFSIAFGYLAGTIISFLLKRLWFIPKNSHQAIGKLDWQEITPFSVIFIPVAITVMVGQVNLLIDNIFAGMFEPEAINYINYAKNLVHFPQALIGVTIGTIIFPMLSKAVAAKQQDGFMRGIENGLLLTLMILLPAVAGMMWLMDELITIVYERGAFTEEATASTALVGYLYLGSVLFFSLQNIMNKAFYSKRKGHIILRISLFSIALNVGLNFLFVSIFDSYLGIPLASSAVAVIYFFLNVMVFQRSETSLNYRYLLMDTFKITLATGLMLLTLWITDLFISDLNVYVRFVLISGVGAASYALIVLSLRVRIAGFLVNKLKK